jgi:hypothetical protein
MMGKSKVRNGTEVMEKRSRGRCVPSVEKWHETYPINTNWFITVFQ